MNREEAISKSEEGVIYRIIYDERNGEFRHYTDKEVMMQKNKER